jgi:hypothetical protein
VVSVGDYVTLDPNTVLAPSGATVGLLGRAGIRYTTTDGAVEVDSEMLAPPMTIAVYPGSIVSPFTPPNDVLAEILGALDHLGFTVQLIGQLR